MGTACKVTDESKAATGEMIDAVIAAITGAETKGDTIAPVSTAGTA